MATTVPTDLRRIEAWVDETAARVATAIDALDQEPPPGAVPTTVSGFPNGVEGDCGRMEGGIGAALDVLVGRIHDLRADVNNLRVLRPKGPHSFKGHIDQANDRRRQVEKQLDTWSTYGDCPGSLTIDVAGAYAKLDIETELGWSVAAVEAARTAATPKHDWWDVDIDTDALAKAGKAAAVAVGVTAAVVAAAAGSVTSGGMGIA